MWLVPAGLIYDSVLLCLYAATGLVLEIVLSAPVAAAAPLELPFCYCCPGFPGITGCAAIFNDSLEIFSLNITESV